MATDYYAKDGETLDWICWKHYGQGAKLVQAAFALDPLLAHASTDLAEQALSLGQFEGSKLQGVVEQVLDANPGLAARGLVFTAGVRVHLPDIAQQVANATVVRLWDD